MTEVPKQVQPQWSLRSLVILIGVASLCFGSLRSMTMGLVIVASVVVAASGAVVGARWFRRRGWWVVTGGTAGGLAATLIMEIGVVAVGYSHTVDRYTTILAVVPFYGVTVGTYVGILSRLRRQRTPPADSNSI